MMDRVRCGTSPTRARSSRRECRLVCNSSKGVRKTRTPLLSSALALASRRDIRVESSRAATRNAQRLPLLRFQMLRQKHNLAYVIAVVRELPVDGLHNRAAFAADEGLARNVRVRQWGERREHAVPPRVP